MKLKHIAISNFKGIQADNLSPESFTCLVGENNAGKSSVMQAIVFALNRPKNIPSAHFYDSSQPVSFDFELSGVTEAHLARLSDEAKGKIAGLIVDEELALRVAYAPGESVSIQVKSRQPKEERYRSDAIDAVLSGKKGQAAIEEALWTVYPEFKAAYSEPLKLLGTAKAFVKEQVAKLPPEQFTSGYTDLPSGISASISPLLPEPIYIPAVKNLNDDLKTSQSTSFGRLLGLLLEDMAEDLAHVNTALEKVNSLFNRVTIEGTVVDGRHAKVRGLESEVEGLLSANFPNVRVQLEIPPPELKTILNAAQIFIDDGSHDLIDNKGDGIKRSLTFALLQAYVNRQDKQKVQVDAGGRAPRPLIFLFEEPELYLHPRSQRVLFNTLARISENHQVLVTTHSPLFFAPGVTASFVRVAKQAAAPKPIAKLFPVNFALNKADAETFRLARFEHADAAFFSQSVVLFEGESDDAYCKHVAQLFKDDWDFERRNVALVRVSGKGNFLKFRNFFESFGISVRLVADLDAIFDGFKHLGTDKETVYPDFGTLATSRGVVLIDEVEAHLHPRWKMQIMSGLRRALPKMTFIATTHDPLCLRGMNDGEVTVLHRVSSKDSALQTALPMVVEALVDLPNVSDLRVEQLLTSDFFQLNSTDAPLMDRKLASVAEWLARDPSTLEPDDRTALETFQRDLEDALPIGATEAHRLVQEAVAEYLKERRQASERRIGELRDQAKLRIIQALRGGSRA